MSLRFRKTITLAPGLRLNLGARGVSLSAGPRGASVTLGRNGLFGNVGLPGTGLSYRTRLDGRRGNAAEPDEPEPATEPIPITATIGTDGRLMLTDPDGAPLPEEAREAALWRNRATLTDLMERRATELNEWSDRLIRPHLKTPAPGSIAAAFVPDPFDLPRPEKPDPADTGLFASWFGGRERAEARYQEDLSSYRAAISEWRAAEENHRVEQEAARARHERWRNGDGSAAQDRFETRLAAIGWPRETLVSYQTSRSELQADVDLPELEAMPTETARVMKQEMRVLMTVKGEQERRLDYATHVHSIGFRIAGEAFAAMPGLGSVLISGFSQRQSRATGQVEEEYLYSVRIERSGWERIDFSQLDQIDPVEALTRFDLRRDMTRTGVFRPILPF
jgi:hypothetical protein